MRNLVLDPARPEHVFAGTFSGVFRSLDGGRTWSARNVGLPVGNRFVHALAVDAKDGRTLYAALHPGGLFRSLDGGGTWRALAAPWPSVNVSLLAAWRGAVYAGTTSGIYRSLDRGRIFPESLIRLRGQRVQAWIAPPYGALAGSERGIYRTADGGAWSSAVQGLRARLLSHLTIDPQNPDRWYVFDGHENVLRSLNGGATWRRGGDSPLFVPFGPFATLLTVDAYSSRVYGGVLGGVAMTDDGGVSWRFAGAATCGAPARVLADSRRARVYVSSFSLIAACGLLPNYCNEFRSDDDGATFSCARDRLPPGASYVAFDPASGILFATSAAGLHRSTDGGDTWTLTDSGASHVSQVVTSATPGLLYAKRHTYDSTTILRSLDDGATWTAHPPVPTLFGELVPDPFDSDHLYALVDHGVWLSTDGGAAWRPLGSGADEVILNGLAFDPRAPDVLYASSSGGGLLRLRLEH